MALNGLNLSQILPASAQWIRPWTEQVLNLTTTEVMAGRAPYPPVMRTLHGIFYPSVAKGFEAQLWFLCGLFSVSTLVLAAALILRLQQGRFWLIHRIDKTIIIPNLSTIYCICALVYAGLGILSIVTAVHIAQDKPFPRYYLGVQAGWIAPLWVGFFCEAWATFSAWYIRKKGAFYRESRLKTVIAVALPFVLPVVAWAPPIAFFYLAARQFNRGFDEMSALQATLVRVNAEWTPAKGFDLVNVIPFFADGIAFANTMREYSRWVRVGYIYLGIVLCATFVVYAIGASLEISHLTRTIYKLRSQARATRAGRSPRPPSNVGTPQPGAELAAQMDDEFFAGFKRQATLLTWARNNRLYSAIAISAMLAVNAGLTFWLGVTPLSITTNSSQFQVEILVACWLNGTLSTAVALLILFRSLDGGSRTVQVLRRFLPFLPFPPAISLTDPSRATTRDFKASRAGEEPPKYPGSPGWAGNNAASPVMEERKAAHLLAVPSSGLVHAPAPLESYPGAGEEDWAVMHEGAAGEYDLDAALDNAWSGFGYTHGGVENHGLSVTLELADVGGAPAPTSEVGSAAGASRAQTPVSFAASYGVAAHDEEYAARGREDSWDAQSASQRVERLDSWDVRGAARPDSWEGAK